MEIFLILTVGALNIACFFIGAKVGQATRDGDKIELPSLSPMRAVRERQDRKRSEAEQSKIDTILKNIESYDGTPRGQKDVPRG